MSTTNERTIRTHCIGEWPGDFKMQDFCEKQQLEALKQLQR